MLKSLDQVLRKADSNISSHTQKAEQCHTLIKNLIFQEFVHGHDIRTRIPFQVLNHSVQKTCHDLDL